MREAEQPDLRGRPLFTDEYKANMETIALTREPMIALSKSLAEIDNEPPIA